MAAPQTISSSSSGSSTIDSLASLYNLINGSTQTTSGGTSTQTESSSISQESMNAMLKSALEGTSGLASVAGGQRTAGGYGSSTNQLLVNDLLTRTASQIAQNNSTKTTTITTPTKTTTTGGVSGSGTAKISALLGGLKLANSSGTTDWVKKNLGLGGGTGGTESTGDASSGVTANDFAASGSDSLSLGSTSSDSSLGFNTSDLTSGLSAVATDSGTFSDPGVDYSSLEGIGIDSGSIDYSSGMSEDPLAFLEDFGMADGGQVKTKKLSTFGASQYNTVDEAVNASQEGGYNAATGSTGSDISVSADQTVVSSNGGSGAGVGGFNSSFSPEASGIASNLGSAARALGAISKNQSLSMVGTVLGVASSKNPVESAALTAANMATKGLAGAAYGLAKSPTLGSVVDIAGAIASPAIGVANTVLGMLGLNSLGKSVDNTVRYSKENVPISMREAFNPVTQLGTPGTAVEARMASAMEGDAMDNMMDVTGAFGTARDAGYDSQSLSENANALSGDALGNMMSQTNSFGTDSGSQAGVTQSDSYGNGSFGSGFGSENSDRGPGGSSGTSDGADTGMADGSLVRAPGDGTTDTTIRPLANGEYVLPADVVKAIGVDKLDALKAKYHTPVAVQKLQKYARG